MDFVQLFQRQIKEKKISIRKISRISGIDSSFLAKVLRGERQPPDDERTMRRLAEALGLPLHTLMISVGRIPSSWQAQLDAPEKMRMVEKIFSAEAGPLASVLPRRASGPERRIKPDRPPAPAKENRADPVRPVDGMGTFKSELSEDLL